MDSFSIVLFLIYIILILMILIYISPVLSGLVLVLVPVVSVYFLPEQAVQFFSLQQFTFKGVVIQNIHILLPIWSALLAIVAYTEIISWYLSAPEKQDMPAAEEAQKPVRNRVEDFLFKLGKIMSGKR